MVRKLILGILCIFFSLFQLQAQSTYRLVQQGNRLLKNGEFSEAELKYRKALDLEANSNVADFNIGNAKYLQEDYDAAIQKYQKTAENFGLKIDQAEAFHNLGNAYLSQKKYEESIEAYKSALRLMPSDMDTKYNLAYAQLMLKKEQEQQEQQKDQKEEDQESKDEADKEEQENSQNGDEEKEASEDNEKEDTDKGEDKQDKEQESDEGENRKEEKDEKPAQAKDTQLSDEQAEQLLKMLQNEEGKLQEKLDEKEKGEAIKVIIEKDW